VNKFVFFLVFLSSGVAVAENTPENFDVLGIKMGMTVDQVRSAIKAANPKFTMYNEFTYKAQPGLAGGGIARIEYCDNPKSNSLVGGPCNDGDDLAVEFGQSSKTANFIFRNVKTNGTVTQQSVRSSLLGKYGSPHKTIVDTDKNLSVQYRYSDSGALYKKTDIDCNASDSVQSSPKQTTRGCGLSIDIGVYSQKANLNDRFKILATDHILMMKEIEASKLAKGAVDAENLKKAKAAPAPKL